MKALGAALVAVLLSFPLVPDVESAPLPTVRLTHPGTMATATAWPGEGISLATGSWVEAVGGAFELHAYDTGTVIQVVRDARRRPREVRRFARGTADLTGLSSFFLLEVFDRATGERAARVRLPFCPSSTQAARLDDEGPTEPTMPRTCWATPVTKAVVWGIDAGWAVPGPQVSGAALDLADGTYDATLSITSRWRRDLAIAGDTTVRFPLRVESVDFEGEERRTKERTVEDDTGGGVPDLAAVPAWSISVLTDDAGADLLVFAATVWNAGTGPLVVEGYRAAGSDTMTAYQYFYEDGRAVRRTRAGSFVFHAAGGHDHWHFVDFAQYSLLDRATGARVRSQKEAFCLAWTDPVNLTLPDASWNPGASSLQTACGAPDSIWIRQTLPVGWGDTYHQLLAGQSFDVTDVPNGRYAIEVGANPSGRLADLDGTNDIAVREIELGGAPGARTVRVLSEGP